MLNLSTETFIKNILKVSDYLTGSFVVNKKLSFCQLYFNVLSTSSVKLNLFISKKNRKLHSKDYDYSCLTLIDDTSNEKSRTPFREVVNRQNYHFSPSLSSITCALYEQMRSDNIYFLLLLEWVSEAQLKIMAYSNWSRLSKITFR